MVGPFRNSWKVRAYNLDGSRGKETLEVRSYRREVTLLEGLDVTFEVGTVGPKKKKVALEVDLL